MKRNKWLTGLTGCGLAILLGYSSLCCPVTAFPLSAVRLDILFFWCVAISLCFALCYTLKLQLIPLCALALLGWYLWRGGSLEQSIEWLLYQISRRYDLAYGCGVLSWSDPLLKEGDITLALCALAALIIPAVCHTVCTGQSAWLAIVASLLPLAACTVVTDTVPETKWLYLLLVGLMLLILPHSLRRTDPRQGASLTAMLILPVLLAAALLFLAVPQSSYDGQQQASALYDRFLSWLPDTPQPGSENGITLPGTGTAGEETVDLTRVGRRIKNRTVVMEVAGSARGTVYLRGQALDTYTGESWTYSGEAGLLSWPSPDTLEPAGTLSVSTRSNLSTQYVPYYARGYAPDINGYRIENTAGLMHYEFELLSLPEDVKSLEAFINAYSVSSALGAVDADYIVNIDPTYIITQHTSLPEDTKTWAEELLEDILQPEDWENPIRTAAAIASYVSASAGYDLNVSTMPQAQSDFARWFLEEQEEGYCVHFATAATVLLRAAGIPARYAIGYLVNKSSENTVVREENAHAWAEYWVWGIGWMVLEATPAGEESPVPTQTEPTASEQTTAPAATEPDAVTTSPSEQTLPVIAPSEPTEQTGTSLQWLWNILKYLLLAGLAVCLLILQWKVRFTLRLRRLRRGSTNARAVALWQEAVYLSRLLSEQPKSGLFATAQKAKFSQHTITPEELAPLEAYIRQARDRLRRKPVYLRLMYQLLLAVC